MKTTGNCELSLIMPVYNESRRIKKGIDKAIKYLKAQKYSWELILISDGSTDNTLSIARNYITSNIHLLSTQQNFGKGHALRLGVETATGKYIFFSDIDLSVPIKHIQPFLKALKKHSIVIGSRRLKKSKVKKHQPMLREAMGNSFTKLANFILGLNHTDHTCGFKAFRSQTAKTLFQKQKVNGWAFDSEILCLAKKMKIGVKEIPVQWLNDPRTKVKIIPDTIKSLLSLGYIRLTCNG